MCLKEICDPHPQPPLLVPSHSETCFRGAHVLFCFEDELPLTGCAGFLPSTEHTAELSLPCPLPLLPVVFHPVPSTDIGGELYGDTKSLLAILK